MPGGGDFDWLTSPIVGGKALSCALDAASAGGVLRPVSTADPIGVDRSFRKFGRVDVSTALYTMDVGRVLLGSGQAILGLPFALGESLFSFHRP